MTSRFLERSMELSTHGVDTDVQPAGYLIDVQSCGKQGNHVGLAV
jgi:hypothetical protein